MKLLGSLTSPFVRKVRAVLAEKRIEYEFILDSPWFDGNSVSKFNPLGKVPVLLLDDESTLYDSRVIVEYLDAVSPNNRLIPSSGRERITVKRWEALGDGICDAAATELLESRRPTGEKSSSWIERHRGKVMTGLQALSDELGDPVKYLPLGLLLYCLELNFCGKIGRHTSLRRSNICLGRSLQRMGAPAGESSFDKIFILIVGNANQR